MEDEVMYKNQHMIILRTCLMEIESAEIVNFELEFKKGQREFEVEVEYLAGREGMVEKEYRFGVYKRKEGKEEIQLIGGKFGFKVQVVDNDKPKKISVYTMREQLEQLIKAYRIDKGTNYILEKLRDIGIN